MEKALVVVPARGGSKGVPRKNLAVVGGRTLIARAVLAAAGARSVERVVVSSDDPAILTAAAEVGAQPWPRADDLAGDEATSESAVLDVLEHLGEPLPPVTVLVQCTSPFLRPDDVAGVVDLVASGAADVAFTACRWHGFVWATGDAGAVGANHDVTTRVRRQALAERVLETGGAYAVRTEGFLQARHRFFGRIDWHLVERSRALEVDDEDDLRIARLLAAGLDED